jgi:hypothetical protein
MSTAQLERFLFDLATGAASLWAFLCVVCNPAPLPLWLYAAAAACLILGGSKIYRAFDSFARCLERIP